MQAHSRVGILLAFAATLVGCADEAGKPSPDTGNDSAGVGGEPDGQASAAGNGPLGEAGAVSSAGGNAGTSGGVGGVAGAAPEPMGEAGTPGSAAGASTGGAGPVEIDTDQDLSPDAEDCQPSDPNVYPGATLSEAECQGEGPHGGFDVDCDEQLDYCACDADEDRYCTGQGDCNDDDKSVHPGAEEICNAKDDNCVAGVDEGFDGDTDGQTTCAGDCNDGDELIGTGFPELDDELDNDCDEDIDEDFIDDDGDGSSEAQGDCDDTQFEIGPGALEFQGNQLDDDCDGTVDEALELCDAGTLSNASAADFAKALGLCNGEVVEATFVGFAGTNGAAARAIVTQFGSNTSTLNRPAEGAKMVLLSNGRADATNHDSGTAFDGTPGGACVSSPHPWPQGDPGACGAADPATVCDHAELLLKLRVPTNVKSFSYQFQLWSSEYPSFRCTIFDDSYLALVTSQALGGSEQNVSFDDNSRVMSVNTGFFDICLDDLAGAPRDTNGNGVINAGEVVPTTNDCSIENGAALAQTGYVFDNDATNNGSPDLAGSQSLGAGATTPLTSFVPVLPGELITLRFVIFDEGDDQLDTTVALDNFQWGLDAIGGPVTQQ